MYMIKFWNLEVRETYKEVDTVNDKGVVESERNPLPYDSWVKEENRKIFEIALTANSMTDPTKSDGNPTDLAITRYMYLEGKGINAVDMRKKYAKVDEVPFNSDRKRMSAWIKDDEGRPLIVMKGASELVLNSCSHLIDLGTGEKIVIDEAIKADVLSAINKFAKKALRTIAICYKYSDSYDKKNADANGVLKDETSDYVLVGIAGIRDVIRPEVPNAVAQLNKAGIQVKMVTGDNQVTAKAIAVECNIIPKDTASHTENTVMLGSVFYDYVGGVNTFPDPKDKSKKKYSVGKPKRFKEIYHQLQVLARSRP